MQNLIFFDKEGNPLNFNYDETLGRYEGDILFPENSSDTFKTQALYLFEKVPAFEYENETDLSLRRFQLFNEYGFHFYAGVDAIKITKVEPTNAQIAYRSKWIYGRSIDSKFKKGTFVRFDQSVFEFTNPNVVYMVVSSKPGAIMIISGLTNDVFTSTYLGQYDLIGDFTVSGVDLIGIYNYITPSLRDTLSLWNEPDFYDRLYQYRKLNIVNSFKNDDYRNTLRFDDVNVVSVKNPNILDAIHVEYTAKNLPVDSLLYIEYVSRTDLPNIYNGPLTFVSSSNRLEFGFQIPSIFRSGLEFKVTNSVLNLDTFLRVGPILSFNGNPGQVFYATGSQVIWENKIYQCIQAYTYSSGNPNPSIISGDGNEVILPNNNDYWSIPDYLPIVPSSSSGVIIDESLVGGQIYLTTDHLYYTQSYTQSSKITMALAAEKFKEDFKIFNIDLYFDVDTLRADLVYPSDYAQVNFYYDNISPTQSFGIRTFVYEKCIEVDERLISEFNYDYSENFEYNIVFTDIDEFGIVIKINKMVYSERISYVYSSGIVDMQRTIDKTLRNWLTRHFLRLNILGILPSLKTIGYSSVYYNSINIQTEFPNIPMEFTVQVGTTANYYIEHSLISFLDIGKYLSLRINGRTYIVNAVSTGMITDVAATLQLWVDTWSETVDDFGIYITNNAGSLRVNIKKQSQRVSITVDIGKSSLPGIQNYIISDKKQGNFGTLITSNEMLLGTSTGNNSFELEGFSTGQVIGINKTVYPLQNIEFNSLYLNPDVINLSYEGPFWGLTNSLCNSSAFTTVAFTIGFGQTGCPPQFVPDLLRGMYDETQFSTDYSIEYLTSNVYTPYDFVGISGMVDIAHVQPNDSIYVLGDNIRVFSSIYGDVSADISITGLTNSISLLYNWISNYLFVLSKNMLYKIDPFVNIIIASYSFAEDAHSQQLNTINGDIYVSFSNSNKVNIYTISSTTIVVSGLVANTFEMVFNDFEGDMYVSTDGDVVLRIDGVSRTLYPSSYSITGLAGPIAYDPENEAVYVFGSSDLYKIDNNTASVVSTIGIGTSNYLLFNNLNSSMNISSDIGIGSVLVDNDELVFQNASLDYGYMALNQFDGDIYVAGGNSGYILTIDATTGLTINTEYGSGGPITKIIYNPDRKSIWAIRPTDGRVIEVQVQLSSFFNVETISATGVNENYYGSLSPDYNDRNYLWLNVREYIRGPRENFNGEAKVSLYYKWFSDNVPQFFMYDFSGDFLPTTGKLAYTGEKPLSTIVLNRKANRDLNRVADSSSQQTIFDTLEWDLDYIDDNFDISVVPEPIQLFLGFNSTDEGGLRSILQLYIKESVDFTINTSDDNTDIIYFEHEYDTVRSRFYGRIYLDNSSTSLFTSDLDGSQRGLKVGQHLAIFVKDVTNSKKQYISNNNGYLLKIRSIFSREIIVDYFKTSDSLEFESTVISDFPSNNATTYLSTRFVVWNREIGRFNVYGQTEVEDERFHIELNNVGKLISSDDVYIFKEYDIKEEGIDWNYLNMKRKEMLMMKNLIYPYIGSYKSIINAINYFGYNDLELYEYYRNVNFESDDFLKLFKVEIPDIFDNTVEGWEDNDFIKNTFPNTNYEDTNLFNLTYRITDKEGNNILYYTVAEVQKKLQGLKYWLQKNIIPITHKILDITGRADFVGGYTITHQSRDAQLIKIHQNFTPITFNMNEAYLLPVNSGSSVYNCVLDFTISEGLSASLLPDYYTVDIRTYEIYREWYAFKNYAIGDRVIYYDKLYESVLNDNKINNPRKFENVVEWIVNSVYVVGDLVKYDRRFYIWSGQSGATSSTLSPVLDVGVGASWFDVTEWKQIDLVPVEKISEYRSISNLYPFNFTVDSNITPYLVIEVTSDNGYGMTYRDRKNFEIKGILDIQELEAFTNLTTKQYRNATLPVKYADVSKVSVLSMIALPYKNQVSDKFGNPSDRIYLSTYGEVIAPHIKHSFPYIIGNSSSTDSVASFRIELSGDFITMKNPYVISDTGSGYVSGRNLHWVGNLQPGSTVSIELIADVTTGGRAYWINNPNTPNNQSLVPLTYSVLSMLATGTNYGLTYSTQGALTPRYHSLYDRYSNIPGGSYPSGPSQSFSSGGNGPSSLDWDFSIFGLTQSGTNLIQTIATYSDNFIDVVDGFNAVVGNFGYVYYQGRVISGSSYRPNILLATYYDYNIISQVETIELTNVGSTTRSDAGYQDTSGLLFGTNSTAGSVTITHSYYPS